MVRRRELDPLLREEVISECSKFGEVTECVVHLNPDHRCDEEEEVVIYVQFRFGVDCEKAVLGMDGRFFGGRKIKCYFFDENLFLKRVF